MAEQKISQSPYRNLPDTAWWHRAVAESGPVDPIVDPKFTIDSSTPIATCGSCFAQHLGRYLGAGGHTFFVAEPAPGFLSEVEGREYQYGIFSTRSGNVYTTRALRQLLDRAYGRWSSAEPAWTEAAGGVVDPFRPYVQERGFSSVEEMLYDREYHLAAVRKMVEEMGLFVFTLGLTEMWERKDDGTALPVCPGGRVGEFDDAVYQFRNQSVDEIVEDLEAVIATLRERNADAKVLLTVSPVPLIATAGGRHVLAATTYSKSVLRVAAENMRERHSNVDYLPSYEIVTGAQSRGQYFAPDLRSVREEGVRHVMGCFFAHFSSSPPVDLSSAAAHQPAASSSMREAAATDIMSVICDEERLLEAYEAGR